MSQDERVVIERDGRDSVLTAGIWLPRPPSEVFPFFADAHNLERLTPSWLRFAVLTPAPIAMGEGTLIDYRLRLRGIPLSWRSVIRSWDPPHGFVDEQVRGPYRRWVHEHRFEPRDGGTWASDRVRYRVLGGRLVDALLVRRDVERIFRFRHAALTRWFGAAEPG
jgi:ligand-binding SRPBCC domain-containing protein